MILDGVVCVKQREEEEPSSDIFFCCCEGAMYFTIKYLAPEKYVPVIAWIDGM